MVNSRKRKVLAVHPVQPAQVPLEEHAQIVTHNRQAERRLGAPELLRAKLGPGKVRVQLLDHFFATRPAIVIPPHRNGRHTLRLVGHQRLESITRAVDEFLAAGPLFLGQMMPNQGARLRTSVPGTSLGVQINSFLTSRCKGFKSRATTM